MLEELMKKLDSLKYREEFVTPIRATEYLSFNDFNRPISESTVNKYSRSMDRGEWKFNGEGIVFSKSGRLLNGQHRLNAIIKHGKPVKMLIIEGADDDVFHTYDDGKSRRHGDVLAIYDFKNYNTLASLISKDFNFKRAGGVFNARTDLRASKQQVLEMAKANPDYQDAANFASSKNGILKKIIPPSTLAFCYLKAKEKDSEQCEKFFEALKNGDKVYDGSPIMLLRDQLMENMSSKKKMQESHIVALIFKAFRYFRKNMPLSVLRVRTEGDKPEKNLYEL